MYEGTAIEFLRGSFTIRGHFWGREDRPQHAVIMSHIFMATEQMLFRYARLLASRGFLCVTYDFCGGSCSNRSDGSLKDMTIMTEKDDLLAVVKGVRERFSVKSITLLGCSQGGLVSAIAAKEIGNTIAGLILLYPALSIPDDARKGRMMFARFDPEHIPDVIGHAPVELGGEYARTIIDKDINDLIGGFEGPVLYLHGTADRIVSIDYARKAKDLYPNCEYHEIEGGGHVFKGECDDRACERIAAFMDRMKAYQDSKNP